MEEDSLGAFKFPTERVSLLMPYNEATARRIVEEVAGLNTWEEWERDGNTVVKGFFDWLWIGVEDGDEKESGISDLIDLEFNLYRHHFGERNGKPNLGWQRNMIFALSQQIVR